MHTRGRVLVAVVSTLTFGLISTGVNAAPVSFERSAARTPGIGAAELTRLGRSAMRVRFDVRYPRVGVLSREDIELKLEVFRGPGRRAKVATLNRDVDLDADRSVTHSFNVQGEAGRKLVNRLRNQGLGAARRLLLLTLTHDRDIKPGDGIDHRVASQATGAGLGSATSSSSVHARATTERPTYITVRNTTPGEDGDVLISAAPVMCMDSSIGFDVLNGVELQSAEEDPFVTDRPQVVTTNLDSIFTDSPAHQTLPDLNTVLPARNPEVRAMIWQAENYYDDGTAPRYESMIRQYLPEDSDNCFGESFLALGADDASSAGDDGYLRWGSHAMSLLTAADAGAHAIWSGDGNIGMAIADNNTEASDGIINISRTAMPSERDEEGDCTYWNWQECVWPLNVEDPNPALGDMVWPGTHDSATYALSTDDPDMVQSDCTIFGTSTADDIKDFIGDYTDKGLAKVQQLAVTQPQSLREQLDGGIRYIDLRVAWDDEMQRWRPLHTMFSHTVLETELQTIGDWAFQHPGETVIVNMALCGLDDQNLAELYDAFLIGLENPGGSSDPTFCDTTADWPLAPGGWTRLDGIGLQDLRQTGGIIVMTNKDVRDPVSPDDPETFSNRCHLMMLERGAPGANLHSFFHADDPQQSEFNELPYACLNKAIAHAPFVTNSTCQNTIGGDFASFDNSFNPPDGWSPNGHVLTDPRHEGLFRLLDLHYELNEPAQFAAALGAGGLWAYSHHFLPGQSSFSRVDILDAWGRCPSIVIADDYAGQGTSGNEHSYVEQIVGINADPESHPCVDPGAP